MLQKLHETSDYSDSHVASMQTESRFRERPCLCVYSYSHIHLNTNSIIFVYSIGNLVIQSEYQ